MESNFRLMKHSNTHCHLLSSRKDVEKFQAIYARGHLTFNQHAIICQGASNKASARRLSLLKKHDILHKPKEKTTCHE
jgi:hypothetical protein